MQIEHNISLKNLNTFGIESVAADYVAIRSERDIRELCESRLLRLRPFLVVGGGSNLVFSHDVFRGLLVHMENKGMEIHSVDGDDILVEAQAGEIWDDFVNFCIDHDCYGVENMAAIPGTVGASPVQNVGAYGTEAKDVIELVRAYDVETGKLRVFINKECKFGYRNSVFKKELKDRYIVASVIFRLHREFHMDMGYKALQTAVAQQGYLHPTARQVAEVVKAVRDSKLPNPKSIGSAGSFFKNPVVPQPKVAELLEQYPTMPTYPSPTEDGQGGGFKIPAAWLIEQSGMKGAREGGAQVYEQQPLVIVNTGNATAHDIVTLAARVSDAVLTRFGITISPEVNYI